MRVDYPDDAPLYDGANLVVRFLARVDGLPVACAITAEALEDHFGAPSSLEAAQLDAFERGRVRIQSFCEQALKDSGGAEVVLHSGLFRMPALRPKNGT
jgi:hypothetical protein